ncbi:hypothetical protein ACFQO4_06345 [Saliphagus sp. GCM10025334]
MDIETIDFDGDSLSTRKVVDVQSKQFNTPVKALQAGKLRASETVSPFARGVVEIYRRVDAAALENSQGEWTGLADGLKRQLKDARDNEFVVPFIEYDDTADLELEHAKEIAKLQTNYGDILTVPLMVPLVKAADDGDDRETSHVSDIIQNTRVYLEAIEELQISKPVMGVIPPISEDCTRVLVELYAENDLRAYCVDFSRRSPMAKAQIDNVINPMMQYLTGYSIREESLIYAVNAYNSRPAKDGRRTADAMYAYTLGFDIVGDNHIAPNVPKEVLEEWAKQGEEDEITMRLFDAETVSIVDVEVGDLDDFLPPEADLSVERIQDRISKNQNEKYRFRNLINTELISLYLESEGGVDPRKIFVELDEGEYTLDSDLERVRQLTAEVRSSE